MDHELDEIGPPSEEIVRVGSHHGPCEPPPWSIATSDLTSENGIVGRFSTIASGIAIAPAHLRPSRQWTRTFYGTLA
ncbi:MAG: hypothetical protein ACRDJ9_16020, partial [Dehalococcoidia bacterium]